MWLLLEGLLSDPASRFHAAVADWEYPLSREGMYLLDIYDLQHASKVKRSQFKPVPRPWRKRSRIGGKKRRSASETLAILRPNG